MNIRPIPAFDDNYIWCMISDDGYAAAVVDPGDADPVLDYLRENNCTLIAILITHKHGDHTGGVSELLEHYPGIPVYGPANESIRTLNRCVSGGDRIELPQVGTAFKVLDVPGHTEGHLAYYGEDILFCGDTLFAAGCGRVFSGTHEQLSDSLQKIKALPPQTRVYCAHEYTLDNLGFAEWVEPESEAIKLRIARDQGFRDASLPTVPSVLSDELETNPFLRTDKPEVIAAAERYAGNPLRTDAEVFTAIRTWKDREYD